MTRAEMMQKIVEKVYQSGPLKVTELFPAIIQENKDYLNFDDYDMIHMTNFLDELVNSGRLIEIKYVLPKMHYRAESMYFPIGTEMTIIKMSHIIVP
jgi:hypothetical protein